MTMTRLHHSPLSINGPLALLPLAGPQDRTPFNSPSRLPRPSYDSQPNSLQRPVSRPRLSFNAIPSFYLRSVPLPSLVLQRPVSCASLSLNALPSLYLRPVPLPYLVTLSSFSSHDSTHFPPMAQAIPQRTPLSPSTAHPVTILRNVPVPSMHSPLYTMAHPAAVPRTSIALHRPVLGAQSPLHCSPWNTAPFSVLGQHLAPPRSPSSYATPTRRFSTGLFYPTPHLSWTTYLRFLYLS